MSHIVRIAEKDDKEGIKSLWKNVFDDSDNFIDWFFENRYHRAFSTCLISDGRVASAMQSYPFNLRIRGRIIEASMLAGVSTYSEYRGKGFMGEVFKAHMQQVRNAGIVLVPHTPANTPTFFSKGHYPVSETKIATIPANSGTNVGIIEFLREMKSEYGNLFSCYTRWSQSYSGIVARSMSDFVLKMGDYSADNAKVAIITNDENTVQAYGIFYTLNEYIHCEEIAFDNSEALSNLLISISSIGKEVRAKIPVDALVSIPGITSRKKLQGVLGVANIQKFLKAIFPYSPIEKASIEITDKIVDSNNGVYSLDGRISSSKPAFTIEAGRLGQVLCGFCTLKEQLEDSNVQVHDIEMFHKIDNILPKQNCFIIDEY